MASASSGKRAEPAVVSVALIVAALEEEERWAPGGGESKSGGGGSAGGAAAPPVDASGLTSAVPKPATAPHEALSLTLSFKGLLKIENMNLLPRLRRLRLDNNSLTRIEGLESVPALEWLDLSFNKVFSSSSLTDLYINII